MRTRNWLLVILFTAALLRLYGLERGDTVNDEVFTAFRAIGLTDFDAAESQTTPFEWWDPNIPWWTRLSFHDQPPLAFFIQHWFMRIFGESRFAFRLPGALFGVGSVYLAYLLGKRLFGRNAGLLASAALAVTVNHIYISRVGMFETYVIFFILLTSYLFLRGFENDEFFIGAGVSLGLALLTKYTSFVLFPILGTYLVLKKPTLLRSKKLWLGLVITGVLFSPVIVYNVYLYAVAGHLDFQFSYIFGQKPNVWQSAPGKEIGSIGERIAGFVPRLIASHSSIFLSVFAAAVLGFLIALFKNAAEALRKNSFLLIAFFYLVIFILFIGPSYRFLTMLTPFMALGIGSFLSSILSLISSRFFLSTILTIILLFLFEIFYSINNQIAYYPFGPSPWLSSKVRYENYNWGYGNLEKWFDEELKGKMPAVVFDLRYEFLQKLRDRAVSQAQLRGLEPYPAIFVYYGNWDDGGKLWTLDRLHIYHAWPILSLETYLKTLKEKGNDFYERSGFLYRYFITIPNIVPDADARSLMSGEALDIRNSRGDIAFQIYKTALGVVE